MPRPLPLRFPVLMWGVSGGLGEETSRLKRIGFTHVLGWGADYDRIWQAGAPTEAATPPVVAQTRRALDDALANDLTVVASLSPGSWLRTMENFRRVNRQGKTYQQEDIFGPHLRPGGLQLVFGRGSMWLSQMDQPGAGGLRRRATLFFMVGLMGFVSA